MSMSNLMKLSTFKKQKGATAIEYGLIASLVSVAAVVAMKDLGVGLGDLFTKIAGHL